MSDERGDLAAKQAWDRLRIAAVDMHVTAVHPAAPTTRRAIAETIATLDPGDISPDEHATAMLAANYVLKDVTLPADAVEALARFDPRGAIAHDSCPDSLALQLHNQHPYQWGRLSANAGADLLLALSGPADRATIAHLALYRNAPRRLRRDGGFLAPTKSGALKQMIGSSLSLSANDIVVMAARQDLKPQHVRQLHTVAQQVAAGYLTNIIAAHAPLTAAQAAQLAARDLNVAATLATNQHRSDSWFNSDTLRSLLHSEDGAHLRASTPLLTDLPAARIVDHLTPLAVHMTRLRAWAFAQTGDIANQLARTHRELWDLAVRTPVRQLLFWPFVPAPLVELSPVEWEAATALAAQFRGSAEQLAELARRVA